MLKSHPAWLKYGRKLAKISRQPKITISLLLLFFIFNFSFYILRDLPSPTSLSDANTVSQSTLIYDRNGKLLYEIFTDQNRIILKEDEIPDDVKKAIIAIEDRDFYSHFGLNPIGGITRALKDTILKHQLQGGSTITQQLIKNTLLSPERTLVRKIKEAILAILVELRYSKEEILTMYLNTVPFGGTAYGIEQAARKYFAKPASELNLAQAALLAGLPSAPSLYSPFGAHPELAKQRQALVLQAMVEKNFITQTQSQNAKNTKLEFTVPQDSLKAPHFSLWVKQQLVEQFGLKTVETKGLKVTTSLDLDLQEFAQDIIRQEITKQTPLHVSNGAALITNPKTGEILAMVGSKDYFEEESTDGKVNLTLRLRSPGSSIKPLNYALGFLKKNTTPASIFIDAPICFPSTPEPYCPGNYDGAYHGAPQIRFALGNSYNIPAVKQLQLNGVSDFVNFAAKLGISTWNEPERYGLSLTLGGAEVRMTDMAVAFGVFANAGFRQDLISILNVKDASGNTLYEYRPSSRRVLPADAAYLINHILLDNNARTDAFGSASPLRIQSHEPVSVKTGTSEDKRDNWTIGYSFSNFKTDPYLAAVWVGNNDNSPMSPLVESGNSGAAPIWNKLMTHLLKNQPVVWPAKPDNIIGQTICSLSGKLPANDCPTRYEFFIKGTEPLEPDNIWNQLKPVPIYNPTGQAATAEQIQTEPQNISSQNHILVSDPFTQNYCFTCPPIP